MRCQRKCLAACPGFSSLLFSQAASEVVLLIPAVLGTHAELKASPYLCYPCRHMEVAARDQREGLFAFFAGAVTQGSVCAFLFSLSFFFLYEMHNGRRESKFNYKAVSSSPLCLSRLGSAIIFPLMQESECSSIHCYMIIY